MDIMEKSKNCIYCNDDEVEAFKLEGLNDYCCAECAAKWGLSGEFEHPETTTPRPATPDWEL